MSRPKRMADCHPGREHCAKGLCEPCYRRENYKKNVNSPIWRRGRHLRKYGMTLGDYDNMIEGQAGSCKICGEDNGGRVLVVDHDWETGEVRGLLCDRCNISLSALESDNFSRYLDYLGCNLWA